MLPKHSVCMEIGVHTGNFSLQILRIVQPQVLHCVDPWKHEDSDTYKAACYGGQVTDGQAGMDNRYLAVCARFDHAIRAGQVEIHRGYSSDVLAQFPDDFFDWVYIDGNHLYEYVQKDLALSFKKVKLRGYITGDDYTDGGWWQGGVKKAVDEFIQARPVAVVLLCNGQFVLRKTG